MRLKLHLGDLLLDFQEENLGRFFGMMPPDEVRWNLLPQYLHDGGFLKTHYINPELPELVDQKSEIFR